MDYTNMAGMQDILVSHAHSEATLRAAVRAVLHRRDSGLLDDEDTITVLAVLGLAEEASDGTVVVPCMSREENAA